MAVDGADLFVTNWFNNSVTELNASTGVLVRVISGSAYRFNFPSAIVVSGTDLFVANDLDNEGNTYPNSPPELDVSTGTVEKVISAPAYGLDEPVALLLDGAPARSERVRRFADKFNASTDAVVRVVSGPLYRFAGPCALVLRGSNLFVLNGAGGSVTEVQSW